MKHAAHEVEEGIEFAAHKTSSALGSLKHNTVDKAADAAVGAAHAVGHGAHKAKDALVGKGENALLLSTRLHRQRHFLQSSLYYTEKKT